MAGYDPTLISNNILQRAFREGVDVSPMKLQKILYFTASEYAKETGRPLLSDTFEAWQYGPVVSTVFQEFKSFSGRGIQAYAKDATGQSFIADETGDDALRNALDRVWEATRNLGAIFLSQLTHREGSAWHKAFTGWNEMISNKAIAEDTSYRETLGLA